MYNSCVGIAGESLFAESTYQVLRIACSRSVSMPASAHAALITLDSFRTGHRRTH